MTLVRAIMDRGALAVETVFLYTLAAGLIVLYAGIQASHELKVQEMVEKRCVVRLRISRVRGIQA